MAEETQPIEDIPKISVFTPIIYVLLLLGIFVVFSVVYRRKRLQKLQHFEPLFGENRPAQFYEFLKQQYTNPDAPKEQKPHEKVMKAALMRRAVEAIRRLMKLKEFEGNFTKLYADGLIGDDIHQQYEIQVKFQELEIQDIARECESFKKGWVQTFFPVCQEVCFNEALRRRLYAMDDRLASLLELWHYQVAKLEEAKPEPAKKGKKNAKKEEKKEEVKKEEKKEEKKEAPKVEKPAEPKVEKPQSPVTVERVEEVLEPAGGPQIVEITDLD